jgi:hypothetical protein
MGGKAAVVQSGLVKVFPLWNIAAPGDGRAPGIIKVRFF